MMRLNIAITREIKKEICCSLEFPAFLKETWILESDSTAQKDNPKIIAVRTKLKNLMVTSLHFDCPRLAQMMSYGSGASLMKVSSW